MSLDQEQQRRRINDSAHDERDYGVAQHALDADTGNRDHWQSPERLKHIGHSLAHESIAVQIEYQESLRFDQGRYQLRVPLVVAPRFSPPPRPVLAQFTAGSLGLVRSDPVPDRDRLAAPVVRPEWGKINPVSLTVNLDAGFPLRDITSDSHKLSIVRNGRTAASVGLAEGDVPSDRDFTFSFTPAASTAPVASLLKEHEHRHLQLFGLAPERIVFLARRRFAPNVAADGGALEAELLDGIVQLLGRQIGMLQRGRRQPDEAFRIRLAPFRDALVMQLVVHSPFGSRLNRAWGLALRKRFCRKFNFELQAAATEDCIVLSLTTAHSFELAEVARYLNSSSVEDVLIQAMLDAPMMT